MNLLLDTHILLWSLGDPARLSPAHRAAIESPENQVWVSSISAWEIAIKTQVGKLRIAGDLREAIASQDFTVLSFDFDHAEAVQLLPPHHRDPFDRALIAQAIVGKMLFVTVDAEIGGYADLVSILPTATPG